MAGIGDPLKVGAVERLNRPGGNVTGFSTQNFELETKRLELLRQIVPHAKRIAVLGNSGNPYSASAMASVYHAGTAANLDIVTIEAVAGGGLESALDAIRTAHPGGVLMLSITAFFPDRGAIVEFMATNRLPAIYPYPEFVTAGGLICYTTDFDELFRQAAD
jgi:putative tryptophan/tyrosine transport system substrate-binding protein